MQGLKIDEAAIIVDADDPNPLVDLLETLTGEHGRDVDALTMHGRCRV